MDLAPDPLFRQVREALRSALVAVPVRPGVHGAPVTDGGAGPARAVLDQLDVAAFERPAAAGGLGLGLTAGVLVSEELGRAAGGNPYRARALAADLGWPDPEGVALAGLEALPGGARGVRATARAGGGWELTGTATADDAEADVFLVAIASGLGRPPVDAVGVGAGMPGADASGAGMPGADASGVDMRWADAAGVDVRWADASGVDMRWADASGHKAAAALGADAPALVAVPRAAPGVSVPTTSWPPVVCFEATPITPADVVAASGDAFADPLARARVRQAAYLLGVAEGAHRIALDYTGSRRQFGTRLRDLPAVSFPLARALVALRATRASVYRAAWLIDAEPATVGTEPATVGTEPLAALAMAAETARDVVRLSMQSCGVRAMTAELGLHRYFRLAAAESARYGDPAALWRIVGAERLRTAAAERELVVV